MRFQTPGPNCIPYALHILYHWLESIQGKNPCQSPNFHSEDIYKSLMLKYCLSIVCFLTFPTVSCYFSLKAGNISHIVTKYWPLAKVPHQICQKENSAISWNIVPFSHVHNLWRLGKTVEEVFIWLNWNPFSENRRIHVSLTALIKSWEFLSWTAELLLIVIPYILFARKWLFHGTKHHKNNITKNVFHPLHSLI